MSSSWQGLITEKNVDTSLNGNSTNPVTSNAIYDGLSGKADTGHGHVSNDILDFIDTIYPVGSIYMTTSDTHPKQQWFGTYWEKIEDKMLLGASSTYTNASTGGSKNSQVNYHTHIQNAHTHTESSHSHYTQGSGNAIPGIKVQWGLTTNAWNISTATGSYYWPYSGSNSGKISRVSGVNGKTPTNQGKTATNKNTIDSDGNVINNDGTGANMPPYLAVNTWQRIGNLSSTNDITNYYLTDSENNTRISHSAPHDITYDSTTEYTRIRIYGGDANGTRYYAIIPFCANNNFQIDIDLYTTGMGNDDCGVRICDKEALDNDATWKSFGAWIITGQGRLTYGYGGHDTNSTNFLDTRNYSSSITNNVHLRYTFKFLKTQVYYNIYNLDTNANVVGGTYTRTDSFGDLSGKYYLYIGGGKFTYGNNDKSVYIKNLTINEI